MTHPSQLTPDAQVEWDRALEQGEAPPCRALMLAGLAPGDWCWHTWGRLWPVILESIDAVGGLIWYPNIGGMDDTYAFLFELTPLYKPTTVTLGPPP